MYDKKNRRNIGAAPDGNDLFIEDDEELEEELAPEEEENEFWLFVATDSPHYC